MARTSLALRAVRDRKSTRLNSSHANISYAVFFLKKKTILGAISCISVVICNFDVTVCIFILGLLVVEVVCFFLSVTDNGGFFFYIPGDPRNLIPSPPAANSK